MSKRLMIKNRHVRLTIQIVCILAAIGILFLVPEIAGRFTTYLMSRMMFLCLIAMCFCVLMGYGGLASLTQAGIAGIAGYDEMRVGKARTLAEAESDGIEFFDYLGVKTLAEARALDAFLIRDKFTEFMGLLKPMTERTRRPWGSVIDNNYVVGNAIDLMQQGKRHMVPLMMGHTPPEFPAVPHYSSLEEFKSAAAQKFGDKVEEFWSLVKKEDLQKTMRLK